MEPSHYNCYDLAFPECKEKERKILTEPSMGKHSVRATIGKRPKKFQSYTTKISAFGNKTS